MQINTDITLLPEYLYNEEVILETIARSVQRSPLRIKGIRLLRRSIDARKSPAKYNLRYEVWVDEAMPEPSPFVPKLQLVGDAQTVFVVGLGPAGLFAALRLIELGLKPIVLERGKDVRARRRDLALLNKEGLVNPESNYCFGEGGAGTFSDGKLYTRSTKRGDTQSVLNWLHYFGASADILIDAHPHIGTNKLPAIIGRMSEEIRAQGGEIWFDSKLTDLVVENGKLKAIEVNHQNRYATSAVILATGHSARDIFSLLHERKIEIQAKPFALGVRVEHPQSLIDSIQYHCPTRHPNLPAASYGLVQQVGDKGVYSFCMCPGGIICPAATEEGTLVVNGWSPSKRDSPFANSGMVVELSLEDLGRNSDSPLKGVEFQMAVERASFLAGGGRQVAPAQRLQDFVTGKTSTTLPECSYLPGLHSANLKQVLPTFIYKRLQDGFKQFGKQLRGYLTNEAVVVATESRTSSPVKIPRNPATFLHPQVKGLFPCGEGAGYAGGIMSAAIDGQRCASGVVNYIAEEK